MKVYGKDVVIDANGVVSGGTSLPEDRFTYQADTSDHAFTGGASWASACTPFRGTGDFNGDGLQDIYCHAESAGDIDVGISTGSGFTVSNWGNTCGLTTNFLSTGDFNGDGKTDFMCKGNTVRIGLSDGTSLSWSQWAGSFCTGTSDLLVPGDFNGDGRTDLSCRSGSSLTTHLSNGVDSFTGGTGGSRVGARTAAPDKE